MIQQKCERWWQSFHEDESIPFLDTLWILVALFLSFNGCRFILLFEFVSTLPLCSLDCGIEDPWQWNEAACLFTEDDSFSGAIDLFWDMDSDWCSLVIQQKCERWWQSFHEDESITFLDTPWSMLTLFIFTVCGFSCLVEFASQTAPPLVLCRFENGFEIGCSWEAKEAPSRCLWSQRKCERWWQSSLDGETFSLLVCRRFLAALIFLNRCSFTLLCRLFEYTSKSESTLGLRALMMRRSCVENCGSLKRNGAVSLLGCIDSFRDTDQLEKWKRNSVSRELHKTRLPPFFSWALGRKTLNHLMHSIHGNIPCSLRCSIMLLLSLLILLECGKQLLLDQANQMEGDVAIWESLHEEIFLKQLPRARRRRQNRSRTRRRPPTRKFSLLFGCVLFGGSLLLNLACSLCLWRLISGFGRRRKRFKWRRPGQTIYSWAISNKRRNKEVHATHGNHRVVNVNLGRKGLKSLRKLLLELDPDVMVVTEPGNLGARPNIKGFDIIRHKSIAVVTRGKSVQINSHEPIKWQKPEKIQAPAPQAMEETSERKARVHFEKDVEEMDEEGHIERRPLCKKDQTQMKEERILRTSIRMGGVNWCIISVYGPQRADPERKRFWEKLNDLATGSKSPTTEIACLIGDFNAIATEEETKELASAKTLVVPYLSKWEEQTQLFDLWKLHSKEKGITRFKEFSSDIGSRIDRIMVSMKTRKVLKRSHVRVGNKVSDHAPVIWDFSLISDSDWRPVVAYNNSQLNWDRWTEKTSKNWKEWLRQQPIHSTSLLAFPPTERFRKFEEFAKKCHQKVYDMIGVGNKITRLSKEKKRAEKAKQQNRATKIQEKIKVDIKNRILRKKKGEGNRELFAIKNEQGNWVEKEALEKHVAVSLQHFGFRERHDEAWGEERPKLTGEEQTELSRPPSREEVCQVLQKLKKKKACLDSDIPGWVLKESDEEIHERCWEIIITIWDHPSEVPKDWTRSVIRLIPKAGRDPTTLSSWRPIAVGTTMHKIVLSIWAKRLEAMSLKKEWLHPRQFGFVKGRTMKGAADFASFLIDGAKQPVVLQWDIEKAFPSVAPEAVIKMLRNLQVPESFGNILLSFYTDAPSTAIVGGIPGGQKGNCRWIHEWGLKQGCPASPLLLNLWTFPMVQEMTKETNFIQYADDMWAVVEEKGEQKVKALMRTFTTKAGLVVNEEKMKRWTPHSPEALLMMGILVKEGKKETVAMSVDKVLVPSILRGVERELRGWKRVAYVNTVVLPRLRHRLSSFWDRKIFPETRDIDEALRLFCKSPEWPIYTDNDFLYDTHMGLGLLSCEEEVSKDIVCYIWALGGQGVGLEEVWKEAWKMFRFGGCPSRIQVWKEAVEMVTDMEVSAKTYQGCVRNDPFPLGQRGHVHHAKILQKFETPPRSLFEKHGCLEAWESINNTEALKVWTDASVTEKGAAAAVFVESCAPIQLKADSNMSFQVAQKVSELNMSVTISHVDEGSQGRVQGECSTCHKPFDLYTRSFLSRGPTKCDCETKSCPSWMDRVRMKAEEVGSLTIFRTDEEFEGKVQGRCNLCEKLFDVAIRTFIYRGPTKCLCVKNRKSGPPVDESKHPPSSSEMTSQKLPPRALFPSSMVHCFPVRGNAFRAEGLGLIGAKKLLVERGNLERKSELHFLCDNKANIFINQHLQNNPGLTPKHSFYRENQELERELLKHWSLVKYVFVKGHVGIEQNELCDQRAKQEVTHCREGIAEEAPQAFGEVINGGMRVENRGQLRKSRKWMDSFHTKLMGCCKTHMAKRVQIGIERWSGNTPVFQTSKFSNCPWCEEEHGTSFHEMILDCQKTATFRKEVQIRWKTVLGKEAFDAELLFGKVRKTLFQQVCQKREEMEAWKSFTQALKWWERRLRELRRDLGDCPHLERRLAVIEADENEDETNQEVRAMAQEVRVLDQGVVKKGEPDTIPWIENRKEVKRFLRKHGGKE